MVWIKVFYKEVVTSLYSEDWYPKKILVLQQTKHEMTSRDFSVSQFLNFPCRTVVPSYEVVLSKEMEQGIPDVYQ